MVTPGFWETVETRPPEPAVMADWHVRLGEDFEGYKGYLYRTQLRGVDFRCTGKEKCGCRHLIVPGTGRWLQAVCQCRIGECKAMRLTHDEAMLHGVNEERLAADIVRALGFGAPRSGAGFYAGPHVPQVGTHRGAPVYLALCVSEADLVVGLNRVAAGYGKPFILLAPTVGLRSREVEAVLAWQRSFYITLAACLGADGAGGLRMKYPIADGLAGAPIVPGAVKPAGKKKCGSHGRFHYENDFLDVWIDDVHYDLRGRNKARLGIKYLVENGALDERSARHFEKEIDPYVRKHSKLEPLPPNTEIKFRHYFNSEDGTLGQLFQGLIKSAGRGSGSFFLNVE